MELLGAQENGLLVGVALSVVAIGITAFYLYTSRKNTVMVDLATSQVCLEKYDVFISFRGSDVRDGFLSHLIKQLRQEGLDVYVDERLERGEEISHALLEAIEKSIIALVIFSKDYASSTWCLEELVKIVERKRANSQIVIPIFYNIDPSHVRHQKGSYEDIFAQHEQKFKDDLLQLWRFVLKETANLSGYHSSKFGNESDLIDGIVKAVSKKLQDNDTVEHKRLMIGFEKNLTNIESFMKVDSHEVGVLGIWGKGGIGKTTLAWAVFDKFCNEFDSSYFASNVREESNKIGLTCLLEKILSVLLKDENLTQKGRSNTLRRLRRTRVLLVLDDVDTSMQLQYLIRDNLLLGPSSKVIITSRDRHVLISGRVHVVHEVKELNTKESLQLFCQHAFNQAHPKQEYEQLSLQVIKYAGGLPLALRVLGLYLNSRDTKTWDSALKKFRKYSNVEIQTVLRVSYDGLDILEKKIFLDIAFFFRGEKKEDIIQVLDACDDFYAECGIDDLLHKALITISRDNRVEIHDLLQEMAEDIVREESIEHPEKRSRLNDTKEIQDILKNNKGTDAIEGITFKFEDVLLLRAGSFHKMSNLRFLKIKPLYKKIGSHFESFHMVSLPPNGLDSLSNKLRYFYWEYYPFESLPLAFCPETLVEIHLKSSKIKKLWDGVQDLINLKILNLSFSQELEELPDLSMAQNLEIVDLTLCKNLGSIHPSILSLPKLVSLNLRSCGKVETLHGDNHLKSLKHLTLIGCTSLKEFLLSSEEMTSLDLIDTGIETLNLPIGRFNKLEELSLGWPLRSFEINELSCLTSLKTFYLSDFGEIIEKSKLVILFDAWCSLKELHLRNCVVFEIPDNISALSSLKILSLRKCSVESLPNSVKYLSELKEIDLGQCKWLKSLPELPPCITQFYVDECTSLETTNFKSTIFEHDKEKSFFLQRLKPMKWGLDRCDMTEFFHSTVIRAIYNNSSAVRVCYPGSTIPKGFKCSQTGERSITIELAPDSSGHLLGFASCCILSPFDLSNYVTSICRKFHFQDEEIDHKDEKEFPRIDNLNTYHVFVWYDPMEHILKKAQRRRFDGRTTYKFACEFFIGNFFRSRAVRFDHLIKACGIFPIYASELQENVQQMELKLEKVTETDMQESFNIFQRFWNLSWMPRFLRSNSSQNDNERNA